VLLPTSRSCTRQVGYTTMMPVTPSIVPPVAALITSSDQAAAMINSSEAR
jgi:hypothetical protein